jgi:hypothetical protein
MSFTTLKNLVTLTYFTKYKFLDDKTFVTGGKIGH